MEHDALDVTIATIAMIREGLTNALCDAVANGRLFILNGRGEYEQVECANYWKGDSLLSVYATGTEHDEDGNTTRDWNAKVVNLE